MQNQTESDVKSKIAFVALRALNSSLGIYVSIHLIGSTLKCQIIVLGRCLTLMHVFHFTLRTISTTCGFEKSILDCILPYTTYISNIWHIAIYMIAIEKVKKYF